MENKVVNPIDSLLLWSGCSPTDKAKGEQGECWASNHFLSRRLALPPGEGIVVGIEVAGFMPVGSTDLLGFFGTLARIRFGRQHSLVRFWS